MLMQELLARLDTVEEPYDGQDLIDEIGCGGWVDLGEHGFTARPITVWCCTDTWVGKKAIYYQGLLVAVSNQECRKCGVTFAWASREIQDRIVRVVEDLCRQDSPRMMDLINWDEDIGEPAYQLNFAGEVLWHTHHRQAVYKGHVVEVLGDASPQNHTSARMKIHHQERELVVDLDQLVFPIKLT